MLRLPDQLKTMFRRALALSTVAALVLINTRCGAEKPRRSTTRFSGTVIANDGRLLRHGALLVGSPKMPQFGHGAANFQSRMRIPLDGFGQFEVELDTRYVEKGLVWCEFRGTSGDVRGLRLVKADVGVAVAVAESDASLRILRGSIMWKGTPQVSMLSATITVRGGSRLLASTDFDGSDVTFNLAWIVDPEKDYRMELEVVDQQRLLSWAKTFDSLPELRDALAAGIEISAGEVARRVALSIPAFPGGKKPSQIELSPRTDHFNSNHAIRLDHNEVYVVLGSKLPKVRGQGDDGDRWLGTVEYYEPDETAIVRWAVHDNGECKVTVNVVDERGDAVVNAVLAYGLVGLEDTPDYLLSGLGGKFDTSGSIELFNLLPGTYELKVMDLGLTSAFRMRVPSPEVTLTLAGQRGLCVLPQLPDGEWSFHSASLWYRDRSQNEWRYSTLDASFHRGMVIDALGGGVYDLLMDCGDHVGARSDVSWDGTQATVDVLLRPGRLWRRRILIRDGKANVSAYVELLGESGAVLDRGGTDRNGYVLLPLRGSETGLRLTIGDSKKRTLAINSPPEHLPAELTFLIEEFESHE